MDNRIEEIIKAAYMAFNQRNINNALATMQKMFSGQKPGKAAILVVMKKLKITGPDSGRK